MISLKQINYALAVESKMHFKKAADKCFVSPSTLSNAILEMEKQLGFEIFERNNKKVMITKVGKEILEKYKNIKLLMEDIQKISESNSKSLAFISFTFERRSLFFVIQKKSSTQNFLGIKP